MYVEVKPVTSTAATPPYRKTAYEFYNSQKCLMPASYRFVYAVAAMFYFLSFVQGMSR